MEKDVPPKKNGGRMVLDPGAVAAVSPLLDSLPYYAMLVDERHTVLLTNQSVRDALGLTPAELHGQFCPRVVHGTDAPYPGCPLESARDGGATEVEHLDSDTGHWYESVAYPVDLETREGRQVYFHYIRDISARKESEESLKALKEELEQRVARRTAQLELANERLERRTRQAEDLKHEHEMVAVSRAHMARVGELSAGIAHSIRNPLHGLLNSVDHLKTIVPADNEDAARVLRWMKEGLSRMETVTQRLLTLTRQDATQMQQTDINTMILNALAFADERVKGSSVELVHRLVPLPRMQADPHRLGEAVLNLIYNSIDACAGEGRVCVSTTLADGDPPNLVLQVEDDGEGIPADLIDRVFDPFFTTKSIGEGSGLGLAIAMRVVEEHNGQLSMESEPGEGTVVCVKFPVITGTGR